MNQAIKKSTAIDNYDDLETELRAIHRNYQDLYDPYLDVTQGFMDILMKGSRLEGGRKVTCCTYGKPGVKLFVEGTREETERINKMGAEERMHHDIAQKRANKSDESPKPRQLAR